MKVNQRVQLGGADGPEGTVTRVEPSGRFRVTYDSHGRLKRAPRERYWYDPESARNFHYPR